MEGRARGGFHSKKQCAESATVASATPSQGFDLNFPLPGEKGLPCLVKVSQHVCTVVMWLGLCVCRCMGGARPLLWGV